MQETHGQARAIALIRRAPDGSDVGRVGLMFVRPPEFGDTGPFAIMGVSPEGSVEQSGLIGVGDMLHAVGQEDPAKNVPPTSVHFLTTDDTAKLLKGPP